MVVGTCAAEGFVWRRKGSKKANQEGAAKQLPRLCVTGTQLMNEQGDTVVLKGVSYGWHQFWPRFYNASTVAYLSGDWGAEVLRASMGVDLDSACYVYKPEFGINCVTTVVDAAIENNVYAIIDWHSHNLRQEEAKEFFAQMATRYKGVPNVIYEVFNEPAEDSWEQVKAYSVEIIKTPRRGRGAEGSWPAGKSITRCFLRKTVPRS